MINAILKFPSGDYCNSYAIRDTISYIYRLNSKHPLPIRFYGLTDVGYPPSQDKFLQQFQKVYTNQNNKSTQKVWHIIISFPFLNEENYGTYFYFADAFARIFAAEYPVCYAYHTENKNTGKKHSHFHYILSSSSYIPDYPPLTDDRIQTYIEQMHEVANSYGILLQIKY